ncbi:MAG: ABC transporter substrate-binding protein [Rhizobiaceae bacterium]
MRRVRSGVQRYAISGLLVACFALAPFHARAGDPPTVKIAVLKFGTVSWVLDVVTHHRLDRSNGFKLEVVAYAGTQATKVAFQADATDIIVSDWLWISRQRAMGRDYTFVPYSRSVGALLVAEASPVRSLADLRGKKVGIAGGPLDKSWLILNGYARKSKGINLRTETEQVFAAPPLLSRKAAQGELDAILTYWHFSARLEATGFRRIVGVQEAARGLGVKSPVPMIGFVFRDNWAAQHPTLARGFRAAISDALEILRTSDAEWRRIRPVMRTADDLTWQTLRSRFREGLAETRGDADDQLKHDLEVLYGVLASVGGEKLVGPAKVLSPGTLWDSKN